jgi:aspartate aminotransferase
VIIDAAVQQSQTLQFSLKAQELKKQGRDIISLGLGEPDYDTPDHIKQAAADALAAGLTRYGAAPGLPELRELVACKLQADNGIPAKANEVLIVPGAKNALFLACAAVLRPGDEVINLTPCYVSNVPILKLAEPGCVIRNIPLLPDTFRLDRDRILAALTPATRLLLINYPNNPSGKMLDADDAVFLRGAIAERDCYLLSDEIYERLAIADTAHISPAAFPEIAAQVITVNGFSKSYSMTGWRIGYTHAAPAVTAVMLKIHQQLNTNTAAFIQKAAVAALAGPQERLHQFIGDLKSRAKLYNDFCARTPSVRTAPVEGGFFGFLHVGAAGMASDAFATALLEDTGVAVIPGVSFGDDFDAWVRISLAASTAELTEGLKRIGEFMGRHA